MKGLRLEEHGNGMKLNFSALNSKKRKDYISIQIRR